MNEVFRLFQKSPLNRKITILAFPVLLAMINHTLIMLVDTAMVGRLGALEIAAAGLGGVVFMTVQAVLLGGSFAVQIVTARRVGEEKKQAAALVFSTSLQFAFFGGIAIAIAGYYSSPMIMKFMAEQVDLRELAQSYLSIRFAGTVFFFLVYSLRGFFDGAGLTAAGMVSAFAITFSNIFMNWIFIYGNLGAPAMGVSGAGLASALAGIPGLFAFFPFMFSKKMKDLLIWPFRLHIPTIKQMVRLSLAPALEGGLTNIAFVIFMKFAAMIGVTATAASNVVFTTMTLSFMPGFAFGIAATTILGQAMGARKYILAYAGTYRAALYSAVIMGTMGILFILFGKQIIQIFSKDPAVLKEAYPALIIVSLIQIGDAYHMVIGSALRSAGLVNWVLGVYVIVSFGLMLPAAYLLGIVAGLGTAGLWSSVFIWLLLMALIFIWKFEKGDWKNRTL